MPMLYQWHSEGVLHLPAHLTLFGRPFQGRAVSSGAVSRGCSAPTVIERQPLRGLARLLGSGCLGVGILRFNLSRLRAVSFTERESPDGTTDCIVMLWLDGATHHGLSMLDGATHPRLSMLDGATHHGLSMLDGATHPGLRPPLSERGWAAASF